MKENSSIGVTPGFQEISLQPGEVYHGTISVANPNSDSSNIVQFKIFSSPFFVSGTDYSVNFETENDFTQISQWITINEPTGSVSGDKVVDVPFTIAVPENAPGGGQYGAFIIRVVNQDENSDGYSIKANRQVASIIYAKIDGETKADGKVIENKVPSFAIDSIISTSSLVENTGNVHFDTQYTLQVFPVFSNETIYSTEESPKINSVLPGTTLLTFNSWEETPKLGVFRVVQTISYLGNSVAVEKTVFVFPFWFLILWLVFIFGGIAWVIIRSKARKKKAKRDNGFSRPKVSR